MSKMKIVHEKNTDDSRVHKMSIYAATKTAAMRSMFVHAINAFTLDAVIETYSFFWMMIGK